MNAIKQTGDNTFEINASPETMQWLSELALVANTDMATALNSTLVQQWGGWAGYKRRAYLLELETVQSVKGPAPEEDSAKEPSAAAGIDFTNPTSTEDAVVNTLYGFLDAILPKNDREKLVAAFTEIKNRLKTDKSPEVIAKEAVKRALNENSKCACGDPGCENGFTEKDLEALSRLMGSAKIFFAKDMSKRDD